MTGFSKLVLGVFLALFLLSLAGIATARYFMTRLSTLPSKPVFSNEAVAPGASPSTASEGGTAPNPTPPATTPTAQPTLERPPNSYDAVVVQPVGLVLRSGPGVEFQQLGGIDYNDPVLVIKTSDDGEWLNVRLPDTGQEGWIKSGNTQPLTAQQPLEN
ncbi:MAG: SH3 domain-containing protein [Cyanobacteria bacterium]|nr:SH3 domain-containing protein [Cyanobacteriota bacterium]